MTASIDLCFFPLFSVYISVTALSFCVGHYIKLLLLIYVSFHSKKQKEAKKLRFARSLDGAGIV